MSETRVTPERPTMQRKPKEGYRRVTISVREDNYKRLEKSAAVEWIEVNSFLSRQVEKNFDVLIPQLDPFKPAS
jgi:hypothetical protein